MFSKHQLSKLKYISSLVQEKKFAHALKISEELLKKSPNNHILLNMNGFILIKMKKYDIARKFLFESLQLDVNFFEAKLNLGRSYYYQDKYIEAIEFLNQAITLNNKDSAAYYYLANSLYKCNYYEEVINLLSSYVKNQNSNDEGILNILAKSYFKINQINHAEKIYQKLLSLHPEDISYLTGIGSVYLSTNKIKQAKEFFLRALNLDKNNYDLIYGLYNNTDYELTEKQVHDFRLLEISLKNYSSYFCLYKYYEDRQQWDDAYYYLNKVNQFLNKKFPFNKTKTEKKYELIKKSYDLVKNSNLNFNKTDYKLIFIVGLPRCGSTMIENVISMNEKVFSMGEDGIFNKIFPKLKDCQYLNESNIIKIFTDFREYFFSRIKYRTQKKIIIDKSLNNFELIGLINKFFPEAKIINLYRDPINQLFSCFRVNFELPQNLNYTHNQKTLIQKYRLYQNLINFWKKKNIENLKCFNYEDLAGHKEKYFKNLFQYLELDFKYDYLEIQNNHNVSKTASHQQVRKEIKINKNNLINFYSKEIKLFLDEFNDRKV